MLLCLAIAGGCGTRSLPGNCLSGDVTVTQSMALDGTCTHPATFWIVAGDVVLDCRRSVIDARGRPYAIVVGGRHSLANVSVRNCTVKNAETGIYVGLLEPDALKAGRHSRETLYRITPHRVSIERSSVEDSRSVGIYVDDYASEVRVVDTRIHGSGSAGVYLEHSSRENEITGSLITGNGYGKFPRLRFGAAKREGIAVDSSAHNRIVDNRISGNAAGGIFLYKNCHEHARSDPHSVPRWQHANHNLIRDNHLEQERVGVWLAARQSRDLGSWDCGDPSYLEARYFPDYAQHNVVTGNTFSDVETGVLIEDSANTVVDNVFVGAARAIALGAEKRRRATGFRLEDLAIDGNVIADRGAAGKEFPRR